MPELPGLVMHDYFLPSAPLRDLVECIWVSDSYVGQTEQERVLPSGASDLLFHLGDHPVRVRTGEDPEGKLVTGAAVCGARQRPLVMDTTFGPTLGVHFRPGGARAFFDLPAEELAERIVPLDALWGREGDALRSRILELASPRERVRVVEEHLLGRGELRGPRPALRAALRAFERSALDSVALVREQTGLSAKRLSALFRDEVGLGPKTFWRVRRFRAALDDLAQGRLRGADLAYRHGYCDQAHLLREFRLLAGSSPGEYLASRIGTDHVAVR